MFFEVSRKIKRNIMNAVMIVLCLGVGVSSEFFHEPSRITLTPSDGMKTSKFGFSIGYQDSNPAKLVVGAPWQDFVGKVYSCPLEDLSNDIDCSMINMTSLNIESKYKKARNLINPNQYFFFGSSIAATSDYFLTCAPLLTKQITPKKNEADTFGACFLYNNSNGYTEWMDNGVRLEDTYSGKYQLTPKTTLGSIAPLKAGGVGWNTLVDPDGYLMAAKTAYLGDVLYVDGHTPLTTTKSLVEDYFLNRSSEFNNYYNMGYGLTFGYFFDQTVKLYAVSSRHLNLRGRIIFLVEKNGTGSLDILHDLNENSFEPYYLDNAALASMFGYALGAADLNLDGLSELLVGAPAQSDSSKQKEFGALHIYVGGDVLSRNDKNRMRTILADKQDSRFGSAIATNDIDGDNIPEIFVSAPRENSGVGVVYVISGYELTQIFFKDGRFKQIRLSELKITQELKGDSGSMQFGTSLQIVKDVDKNGCDELAIGSPGNSTVRLLRCMPAVNASITLQLIGDKVVSDEAKNFKVLVCLSVTINEKCESAVGSILVNSSVTGNTAIKAPQFVHTLTTNLTQERCENITVDLNKLESSEYTFTTKVDVDRSNWKDKDYKPWAVLSPYSKRENSILVKRYCSSKMCEPELSYEMYWSGGASINTSLLQDETLIIKVENTGHDASSVYVRLVVHGAPIDSKQCQAESEVDTYYCALPKPLKRNVASNITVVLLMTKPTDVPSLSITAELHDEVFPNTHYEPKQLVVEYVHDPNTVTINGSRHELNITDVDLKDDAIMAFIDSHKYHIINNGVVTWENVLAVLEIRNDTYIQDVKISESCKKQLPAKPNDIKNIVYYCHINLEPGATKKIIASIEISKKIIKSDIGKENLSLDSKLSLHILPDVIIYAKSLTQIVYTEILTFANKIWLIMLIVVIVALIILLILIYVLYRYGFFKRDDKKKLSDLRENVRKQSIKHASESSRSQKPSTADDRENCDIEVVDECPFPEEPTPDPHPKDDVVLIEERAQVHT